MFTDYSHNIIIIPNKNVIYKHEVTVMYKNKLFNNVHLH